MKLKINAVKEFAIVTVFALVFTSSTLGIVTALYVAILEATTVVLPGHGGRPGLGKSMTGYDCNCAQRADVG